MLSEPEILNILHDAGLFPRSHPTAPRFTERLALRVVRAVEAHYTRKHEMRFLHGHKVNPANDKLEVEVLDEPGSGGANHVYRISGYQIPRGTEGEKAVHSEEIEHRINDSEQVIETYLVFQNGPIAEAGVNGITHEALLAVLIDRLEAFQRGAYANEYNAQALDHLNQARTALMLRTQERMARGVEGTHKK